MDYIFRKRGMRERVEMDVFTPEPAPLPVAGPSVGQMVQELLQKREIGYHPRHRLTSVNPAENEMAFENGATSRFDLLVAIPPHKCPEVAVSAGLTNESGWVPVNRATLETSVEGVYALGDMTSIPLASGMALPKAGVFAHGEAEVVARNIAADIEGGKRHAFGGGGA